MSFLFNLIVAFVLIPVTIILILLWIIIRKRKYGKLILFLWLPALGLITLVSAIRFFTDKMEVKKEDIYGTYIIDHSQFSGKQADWQYNNYRFEITKQDSFLFHITDRDKIKKTYRGKIFFIESYKAVRVEIIMDSNSTYHIIEKHPTLYRQPFAFYYVFYSPLYNNVFFKKGSWKAIE